MGVESAQNVMAVLPHGFDDDERRTGRDVAKNLHPVFLTVNESVPLGGVVGVAAPDLPSFPLDGSGHSPFDLLLRRPALLIRREAKIAACN